MLFDEKDLRVFDNNDSRLYFKEILQSYYSQNYRATIVLLYSFVIYDLFIKLQTMANEGDKKASIKLDEINAMISDGDKYSKVENEVIDFFKVNCPVYFERFIDDVEYLKNCRNKCAHLKVNDNSLFVPNDYHVRMLICSMYDNVLSVKAPFIMDLFSIALPEVESYSDAISYIPSDGPDENIKHTLTTKYLKRMTYDSLRKSYKTFIKLLLVSDDEKCIENITGLYVFAYAMTDYIVKNGFSGILQEADLLDIFSKVKVDSLDSNDLRRRALVSIISEYSVIMDTIRANNELFDYLSDCVLLKPQGLHLYRAFYPRSGDSVYGFFKEHKKLHDPESTKTLYKVLSECADFDLAEFMIIMIKAVPGYYGFDAADVFMTFFKEHLEDVAVDTLKAVMEIYMKNRQCTHRIRHEEDYTIVMKYIEAKDTEGIELEGEAIPLSDNGIPF